MKSRTIAGLAVLLLSSTVTVARAGEPDPGTCKLSTPTLVRLGYAQPPGELGRGDRKALKQAQKAVAKKVLGTAKKLLDPLAATYSEDPEVRFLLAAVQASEGALSAACSELAHVLEVDFPAFAPRFEKEPAFEGLRRSPDGARLAEHVKALAAIWRQAARDGLPSVMARGRRDDLDIWYTKYLRGGVYLHEVKRFLPLGPSIEGAAAVLLHPQANRAAVVSLKTNPCRADFCPRVEAIDVRDCPLEALGEQRARWHYDGENVQPLELRSSAGGLDAKVRDCSSFKNCMSPWQKVGGKSSVKPVAQGSPAAVEDELTLKIDFRGFSLGMRPSNEQVKKGRLVTGEKEIALDPRHDDASATHDILVDRSTGTRLILSTIDGCRCGAKEEGAVLRHVLSRVDADGKATVLTSGKGPAAALLDGKGAFYLQTGDSVLRWPNMNAVRTAEGEPIMAGVLLVIPVTEQHNCCGL
jgi:hypothetical protein